MKKKISKILGVGLSLALLTGLVAGLVPALAVDDHIYDLQFGVPKQPGNTTQIAISVTKPAVAATANIVDMAVTANGAQTWAVTGAYTDLIYTANRIYRADYGGYMWTPKKIADEDGVDLIAAGASNSLDLVAVASDDADLLVVADAQTAEVFVSRDAAATWVSLGVPDAGDAVTEAATLHCLDINREFSGKRYIAVGGIDTLGNAGLWYIDLTGVPTTWLDAMETADGWDAAGKYDLAQAVFAAEFSPNFPADRTMLVVTGPDPGAAGNVTVQLQMLSFDAKEWNDGFAPYGANWNSVTIETITALKVVLGASISMPDDYLASDESTRVAFVGLATDDGTWTGNAYRFDDYKRTRILGETAAYQEPIKSVAYNTDGDKLVIGKWLDNNVLRSANPMANEPDLYDSKSLKRPGLNTATNRLIVMWAGTSVIAGSSGTDSAYSKSTDDGKTFDDLGFVMDMLWNIEDIAFTSTGTAYMLTTDNAYSIYFAPGNLSLWRGRDISENFWVRVLTLPAEEGYIVRTAPDDPAVVYVGKLNDHTIYYSADSGATWAPRYCGVNIVDIAVESAEVLYGLDAAGKVSKSEDAAFVWSSPAADSKCTSGATITSIGVDQVLVGSKAGKVSYSTDGNESWTAITPTITAGNVQVTASGLETGDSVYAASDAANSGIWRFTFGTNDAVWTLLTASNYMYYDADSDSAYTAGEGAGVTGLVLAADGTLYATAYCADPDADGTPLAAGGTYDSGSMLARCLVPYYPEDVMPYMWDRLDTDADFSLWIADYDADAAVDANEWRPRNLIVTSGSNEIWAVDRDWLDLTSTALEEATADEQPAAFTNWGFSFDEMYRFADTLTAAGPTLLGPDTEGTVAVNVMTGFGYPVVFSWEQLSRAKAYKLYLAYDEGFTQNALPTASYASGYAPVRNDLLLSTVANTIDITLVPGTTYWWRVKANEPVASPYSEKRTFTVLALAPAVAVDEVGLEPVVSGPAFGADEVSTTPTFTWAAVAGATYEFVLAEELGLDDPFEIIDYSATCDLNAHVAREELKFSTTYHWRVRAVTADATSEWVRGLFTTEAAPAEPVEPTPPVIIEEKPAPEIILQVPATPAPVQVIPDWALYTIIVVGAVLVISVIVLIVRTRRVV